MTDPTTAEACEYAALIADICKLSARDGRTTREMEARIFQRLGYETTLNKRGYCIREKGASHWQSQPQVLSDFGTAVMYTIGNRYGTLEGPLERNWYIREMCEVREPLLFEGDYIAAWAVTLSKAQRQKDSTIRHPRRTATAITPAAALVAAWLRAHP